MKTYKHYKLRKKHQNLKFINILKNSHPSSTKEVLKLEIFSDSKEAHDWNINAKLVIDELSKLEISKYFIKNCIQKYKPYF